MSEIKLKAKWRDRVESDGPSRAESLWLFGDTRDALYAVTCTSIWWASQALGFNFARKIRLPKHGNVCSVCPAYAVREQNC